jgi:hypothetical protein
MGTSVTPGVGLLQLTGFAPQVVAPQGGRLQHRFWIAGVGSTTEPGDPDPLPDTDTWFTSRRRVHHPWIADDGSGSPDISVDGQRLDPALGHVEDGEVQIRVIDVPAPITAVACDVGAVLVPEDDPDVHLDSTAFSSGFWAKLTSDDHPLTSAPSTHWGVNANGLLLGTFALFGWTDPGSWVRSTLTEATLDGTEGGGSPWTPGQIVGLRARVNLTLDTGGGNAIVELQGAGDAVRIGTGAGFDFWNIPEDPLNQQVDSVVYVVADGSGHIKVRLGAANMFPSFNLVVGFTAIEIVECEEIVVSVDSERYVTGWLADSDARQQVLGRKAYLEESLDGGVTWSRVLYAGYVKQITMDLSLTYQFTLGDAGRGRRVSRAWSGLNPVEDFTP